MRVLIVGLGLVGGELARLLRGRGDAVVGTTTTQAKVEALRPLVDEVRVLRGSDAGAVARAAAGVDAVAVCAGPNAQRAMSREDRAASYREVLVDTARSVVAAAGDRPIVALSSLSVYGDAADHLDVITEEAPTTGADDPSPVNFLAMERTYLEGAAGRACILRCADIYGAADPPIEAKVRMAHQYLGGSVPFGADALLYRVEVRDVAAAVAFALDRGLTGVYNLAQTALPPTNAECFDAISAKAGLPPLQYRGEIRAPRRPISVARLLATGFRLEHSATEGVPA